MKKKYELKKSGFQVESNCSLGIIGVSRQEMKTALPGAEATEMENKDKVILVVELTELADRIEIE